MNQFFRNMEGVLKALEDAVDTTKNASAFNNITFALVRWIQATHKGLHNLRSASDVSIVGRSLKEFGEIIYKDLFNSRIDKSFIKFKVIPAIKELLHNGIDDIFLEDCNVGFNSPRYCNYFTTTIMAYTILFIYFCNESASIDIYEAIDYKSTIYNRVTEFSGDRLARYIKNLKTGTNQILEEHFFLNYNYSFSLGFSLYDFIRECLEEATKDTDGCIVYTACGGVFIFGDFHFLEEYRKVVFNKLKLLGMGYY